MWNSFPVALPTRLERGSRAPVLGLAALLAGWATVACGSGDGGKSGNGKTPSEPAEREWIPNDPAPPTARMTQVEEFRRDLAAVRHPSDGGGHAVLQFDDGEPAAAMAGRPGRWTIVYTVGPEGIAAGGGVYFMPEPFWGWSAPQDIEARAPGFTLVTTEAEGVELETQTLQQMLLARVTGRAMVEGETMTLVYGAGERGAQADLYAERGAHLWVAVDGDGDGVRQVLADSPTLDVEPGPAERVAIHATSVLRPGETGRVTVALLDGVANPAPDATGTIELSTSVAGPGGPLSLEPIQIEPDDRGRRTVQFEAPGPGVYRLAAEVDLGGFTARATSNPIWVDDYAPRVFWGDLHGHSNYSDGTGLPEDYFSYARDVAALDVTSLTDHDHFGVLFLDQNPELWEDIQTQTKAFHEPGRFVTLLGLEWTSWIHGHRHILYFSDEGRVLSSVDPDVETPSQLWDALRGERALTFAHHSAGDPVPTNWTFAPDPELEPVTEIMSVHGSSEAADSPVRVRGAVRGNFVRDVLDRGYRLGFIGSGDGHDGHPGLPHFSPTYGYRRAPGGGERMGNGGLAGLQARELTREAVLECMKARRVYATSGPRILLDLRLGTHPLGSTVRADELGETATLEVTIIATAPLATLDVVRSGEVDTRYDLGGELDASTQLELASLSKGEYVYLRVIQEDGGMAWSSPFYVD